MADKPHPALEIQSEIHRLGVVVSELITMEQSFHYIGMDKTARLMGDCRAEIGVAIRKIEKAVNDWQDAEYKRAQQASANLLETALAVCETRGGQR